MTMKFKNSYESRGRKPEFFREQKNKESLTQQDQLIGASIVEMAKRYGIDAIIQKAKAEIVENQQVLDKMYGHDLTQGFKSKEELLNIKKKMSNLFENIPAKIRKEQFNDDVVNFVNAYTTNDEIKLTTLNKLGIVSDTQLQKVKDYNNSIKAERQERQLKEQFLQKLEQAQGGLYETFKQTGNITISNNQNFTAGDKPIQEIV